MILDSSALFAVILGEPQANFFLARMMDSEELEISAGTLLEARIVAWRRNVEADLEALLSALSPTVVPFDTELSNLAFEAYRSFGPPHPARLNFGDCFSYATARSRGKPLLFQGDDFSQTELGQPGA